MSEPLRELILEPEMLLLIIIAWVLVTVYLLLLIFYRAGWGNQTADPIQKATSENFLSVIIPARNEGRNLGNCLNSISKQKFPVSKYEVIVVDDNSDDNTVQIAKGYPGTKVLSLSEDTVIHLKSHKKTAITKAVNQAKGNIIVSTDADCTMESGWLEAIDQRFSTQPRLMAIAGPVKLISPDENLFTVFQSLDFAMYQGITAAGINTGWHHLANGANLAYRKSAFEAVNGFSGHEHLPTGDDMLLVQKIRTRFPGSVQYLKENKAVVSTLPCPDLKSFIHQRIRWASKSAEYTEKKILPVMVLVFLVNLTMLLLGVLSIFNSSSEIWGLTILQQLGLLFSIKILSELILIIPVLKFFKQEKLLWFFILLQPFHICYTVSMAFLGLKGSYEWKGRQIRKSDQKK